MEIKVTLESDKIFHQMIVRIRATTGQFAGDEDLFNEKISIVKAIELRDALNAVLEEVNV